MSKKNVILKINEDKFTITIEECNNLTIEGNYDYVTDYESFIFYSESCEIDFLNSNENQLILHTDLQSECIDLNNIIFTEY